MWSGVEWSASRQRWCIQDAAGHCLTHTESIVGQDRDVQTAIRLAKRMIVSGEMPTPEEAHHQLKQRQEHDRLGEPLGEPLGENHWANLWANLGCCCKTQSKLNRK